jgi:hypothetical protein
MGHCGFFFFLSFRDNITILMVRFEGNHYFILGNFLGYFGERIKVKLG